MLDAAGERVEVDATFWHVGLEHYRLPENVRFPDAPQITHETEANFGGLVRLLGWSQPATDQYILYWQAIESMTDDLAISLRLVDGQGAMWGQEDRRPGAYLYPTTRWKPGEIVFGQGSLPAQAGTPSRRILAGGAGLCLGPARWPGCTQQSRRPPGTGDTCGAIRSRTGRPHTVPPTPFRSRTWWTTHGKTALRCAASPACPIPSLSGTPSSWSWPGTRWGPACPALEATLQVRSQSEPEASINQSLSLFGAYPPAEWQAGEWLRAREQLQLPASWPVGPATVQLIVSDASGPLTPTADLGAFTVTAPERTFDAPANLGHPIDATVGDLARLLGLTFEPSTPQAGDSFVVTLYWQPVRETDRSYSVFVHLLDAGQHIAAQYDRLPADGARPSTGWVAGEIIADQYAFERLPEGGASLAIGLYDTGADGMPRRQWRDETNTPLGDMLHIDIPVAP